MTEVGSEGSQPHISTFTSTGPPRITEELLRERPQEYLPLLMQSMFQPREPIEVKGKGMMETFLCNPSDLATLHPELPLASPALLESCNDGGRKTSNDIKLSSLASMLFSCRRPLLLTDPPSSNGSSMRFSSILPLLLAGSSLHSVISSSLSNVARETSSMEKLGQLEGSKNEVIASQLDMILESAGIDVGL